MGLLRALIQQLCDAACHDATQRFE